LSALTRQLRQVVSGLDSCGCRLPTLHPWLTNKQIKSARNPNLNFARFLVSFSHQNTTENSGNVLQHDAHKDEVRSRSASTKFTHFGYENVSEEDKKQKVYDVFANVAETYDLMNDAMSGGLHRLWKDYFVRKCNPALGKRLLDVAGGTGDIAFRYLDGVLSTLSKKDIDENRISNDIVICDINKSMLEVGRRRAHNLGIDKALSFAVGDAESLHFEDDSFDLYTIAFGIRNVTHIEKVLDEAYRVLRPGGRFMCLEFSDVSNPLLKSIYDTYSFQVIPVMGQVIASDWNSYKYLVESIRQFPNQETFAAMIEDSGFSNVTFENLLFGVVAIHSGFKI